MLSSDQFFENCSSRKVYQNTDPYPKKPPYPALLNKSAKQLTDDDMVSLPSVKNNYDIALKAYQEETNAWKEKDRKLVSLFWEDFNKVFELDDSKFASELRHLAWERGHSSGLSEVANEMIGLSELWNLYNKKGT